MIKIYKIVSLLIFFSISTYSQVTVSISNITLDSQPVPSNTKLNLGTSPYKTVRFILTVTKPNELTLGTCLLTVGIYTSTGTYTMKFSPEFVTYSANAVGSQALR